MTAKIGGKMLRPVGEDVQMHMGGHLGINDNVSVFGKSSQSHQIYKHAVVFLVPEHYLVVRRKTQMIGFSHSFSLFVDTK